VRKRANQVTERSEGSWSSMDGELIQVSVDPSTHIRKTKKKTKKDGFRGPCSSEFIHQFKLKGGVVVVGGVFISVQKRYFVHNGMFAVGCFSTESF